MVTSVCREAHPLDKCEQFKKMSPEQREVKANELHLCLTCLRHTADKECFAKGKADFKGCSEGRCGMEHHPMLHWALIVARLFQVQVVAESYPPGTQVFQLQQRVKIGKTEVSRAFDGGSNQSAITKEYDTRKKLKKVGFTVPVVGFGSPEPEMGELYEGPLRTSGKREVIIKTVAGETIYNSPAATCPENIATRFLQSRNAKSWDLDQAEGQVDVCLGMDYPHLQPRHLEKEFRGGQLHLNTSVFGSDLILAGLSCPRYWRLWTSLWNLQLPCRASLRTRRLRRASPRTRTPRQASPRTRSLRQASPRTRRAIRASPRMRRPR
jgi:hypothetical protein